MGWDTEVIIIAENIQTRDDAKNISEQIFENDSKCYGQALVYIIENQNSCSLFFTYERRKYLPYWVIEKISVEFINVEFTLLGSCPDFLAGPAGHVKIKNGKIIDSYGIWEGNKQTIRIQLITNPRQNPALTFEWYKWKGNENRLREDFIKDFPLTWCNGNYSDKIIPIQDTQELIDEFVSVNKGEIPNNWKIHENLK